MNHARKVELQVAKYANERRQLWQAIYDRLAQAYPSASAVELERMASADYDAAVAQGALREDDR